MLKELLDNFFENRTRIEEELNDVLIKTLKVLYNKELPDLERYPGITAGIIFLRNKEDKKFFKDTYFKIVLDKRYGCRHVTDEDISRFEKLIRKIMEVAEIELGELNDENAGWNVVFHNLKQLFRSLRFIPSTNKLQDVLQWQHKGTYYA